MFAEQCLCKRFNFLPMYHSS